MPNFVFSQRSLSNLEGVHPDLVDVAYEALRTTSRDFMVIEGVRSLERQQRLYDKDKSRTMNSRHLTGHAIDIAPWPYDGDFDEDGIISGHDWDEFYPVADAFLKASRLLNIPLRWGGNWNVHDLRKWNGTSKLLNQKYRGSFPDAPHFELTRRFYP